uniref:Uncharacterized protein n=1 Tax=Pseudomonas fluorescens (strain SBW25) TaxID=216595 RepID=A0A0G4E4B5_PSEFS|nr:hypothetical protein PQBR57_0056 [Pseudomonas fluorescens SBW25]
MVLQTKFVTVLDLWIHSLLLIHVAPTISALWTLDGCCRLPLDNS